MWQWGEVLQCHSRFYWESLRTSDGEDRLSRSEAGRLPPAKREASAWPWRGWSQRRGHCDPNGSARLRRDGRGRRRRHAWRSSWAGGGGAKRRRRKQRWRSWCSKVIHFLSNTNDSSWEGTVCAILLSVSVSVSNTKMIFASRIRIAPVAWGSHLNVDRRQISLNKRAFPPEWRHPPPRPNNRFVVAACLRWTYTSTQGAKHTFLSIFLLQRQIPVCKERSLRPSQTLHSFNPMSYFNTLL